MVRLLNAAQVPHPQPHLCWVFFYRAEERGYELNVGAQPLLGVGQAWHPVPPPPRRAVSPALAPELVERDKGLGRAWLQPDPISKEFERRPFV